MYKPKLPKMIVTAYLKLKTLIKSEGKLFASSGLLTFIRLGSGLLLLKLVATIGGNPAIAMYGQVHNVVSMANGIVASGAGDGVVKMTAQNQGDPSKISIIKSASILLVGLCSLFVILISTIILTMRHYDNFHLITDFDNNSLFLDYFLHFGVQLHHVWNHWYS